MTYIKLATESVGDAGDQYTGLDRFGRIADQRWINGSNTDVDRYQYGYDRDGNRLYKDNKVIASLSEVYTYDTLNQLASYKLGTLNGTKTDVTGSPTTSQSWDYDPVGNWDSITTNSATQTRTANKQNEITAVSGATTPAYDSNGNLTTDENNHRFVYDAWNKVVQVKNSSNVVIVAYGRDALHRHVTDTVGSTVTDRFFSSDWQVMETKVGSNTITRNVWSPVYVDGLVLRDRDTDANGTLDERLYLLQDANWNTTALVNSTGTVQERYTYTPFGQVTFRDGSGSTLSGSAKDWVFLHQSGERIAGGDYEFRNRVYSPSLGRWLSNDPLGFEAGDQNWYRAIGNNPGNGVDPSGLDFGIGGLVVDEMPEIPRNPFGFEVPKNPEDTFLGLIKDDIRDTGSQIVGMLPGVGDYKDIQEVIFGYDMITGKWLTVNDRLWTAGAALIPGLGGATIRKLANNLDPVGHLIGKNIDDLPGPSSVWRQDIAPSRGGGPYDKVRAGNTGGQVHHTPAAKVTPFEYRKGPSVWMETVDHRKTASWGSSKRAEAYRAKQDALINSGKLREAIQMDIDDIRSLFGNKYDANIKQVLESFGFSE